MKRFAGAAAASLLAAWVVWGHRAPAPQAAAGWSSGLSDREAQKLLEQFDRLQNSLRSSGVQLQGPDEGRRLLGEARELLAAARERLEADYRAKQRRLDDEAAALREQSRKVKAEWGQRLAQPAPRWQ